MLIDMMGIKMAVKMDDALKDSEDQSESDSSTVEVTDETKTIAGYDCKKVIVTQASGDELIMWVTEDIKPENNQNKYGSKKVSGFPLQIESEQNMMEMKFTATSVEKKADKKLFSTDIPEGYTEKTIDDLKAMGMGGLE